MTGRVKPSEILQAPFIQIKTKITVPGISNIKMNM